MSGQIKGNKGIIFTIDALFGAIILVSAVMIMSQNFIIEDKTPDMTYLSYDLIKGFSSIKTSELNNSYLKTLIADGTIINANNTLLETIGELYVLNKTFQAENLARNISLQLIPSRYGFSITVNDDTVYTNNKTIERSLMSSKRLISGIERFKPVRGSTSKVFLQGLEEKKDSSYIFFGGFIGQGNISKFVEDIPSDANITDIYMEMEIGDISGDQFNVFFNGYKCGGDLTRTSTAMQADSWDLSGCKENITPGVRNNISISFIPVTNLDISYISGGFIRFDYITKEMYKQKNTGYEKYYFPSIDGLINLYSSVYIPGNITNMNIQIRYFMNHTNSSNNTFYLKLGNTTIFQDFNSTNEVNVNLDGGVLISKGLNYSFLSKKNIPIRMGAENVSYYSEYLGNADAVLVTDLSGSMNWKMDSSESNGNARDCDDPLFNDSSTKRLSVAICLDNEFSDDVLNITGNKVGLIAYRASTDTGLTIDLTTNFTIIKNSIDSYSASGQTCICCGINSGSSLLSQGLLMTTLIAQGSTWLYNNFSFKGYPSNDAENNSWYDLDYNDSLWGSGLAVLGTTNGYSYSPSVDTEIGYDLSGNNTYMNLWENTGDAAGAPNDFSSGTLNYTANTYGLLGNDDGWDWDNKNGTGPFGYDDDIDYNLIVDRGGTHDEVLEFDNRVSGSNRCADFDCSGAYGIEINITSELYAVINTSGGMVIFSFWYWWDDNGNDFDNADQVWIKSRITKPSGENYYLGENKDSLHQGGDDDLEIDARDDPNLDFWGTYTEDIANYIDGPGNYYIEVGGKLLASRSVEDGWWRFDDIELYITNSTDHYYFRKEFTINDMTKVKKGVLNVLSDDRSIVYLNGNIIDHDFVRHDGDNWNRNGINIDGDYFKSGTNIIAVEVFNSKEAAKLDLELLGVNDSRSKAMLVMTDGVANEECVEQGTGDATTDAIQAACDAAQDYGIAVYSVGFSDASDQYTVEEIAKCGNGRYAKSSDVASLQEFYKDVAAEIMDVSRVEQKIVVSGSPTLSKLYGSDSFIEINYTPPVSKPVFGEISVNFEVPLTTNCTFLVNVSPKVRVIESKVSGYSSSKWYDFLHVNGNATHNLSLFNPDYVFLGDPFIASFNPGLLTPGSLDNITLRTGVEAANSTGCSENSTFFYTALMKASVSYSDVLENAAGCEWTIEFEDTSTTLMDVPQDYNGSNSCSYTNALQSYNQNDTYDDAMYNLMKNLDLDEDGRVDINLVENNFIIGAISVHRIPYPWGPAIAEVRIWQ